jgi:hypothetical protein
MADTARGPDTEPVGLDTAAVDGPAWADDLDMAAEPVLEALVILEPLAASMAVAEVDSTAVAAATVAVDTGKLN